jgi:hypothetical protein
MLRHYRTLDNWLCDRAEDALAVLLDFGIERRRVLRGIIVLMGVAAAVSGIFTSHITIHIVALSVQVAGDALLVASLVLLARRTYIPYRDLFFTYRLWCLVAFFLLAVLNFMIGMFGGRDLPWTISRMLFWALYAVFAFFFSCKSRPGNRSSDELLSRDKLKALFPTLEMPPVSRPSVG